MSKPTQLPEWASNADAVITPEPTSGKKGSGWVSAERPPFQYFNWWMRRVYEWCRYLDNLTNEALTWATKHTFLAGLATPIAPTAGDDVVNKTALGAALAPTEGSLVGAWFSGWASGASPSTRIFKSAGLVTLQISVTRSAGALTSIITLPVGYRPAHDVSFVGIDHTDGTPARFFIFAPGAGEGNLTILTAATTGHVYSGSVTFKAA